jgi:hypothetical protein
MAPAMEADWSLLSTPLPAKYCPCQRIAQKDAKFHAYSSTTLGSLEDDSVISRYQYGTR